MERRFFLISFSFPVPVLFAPISFFQKKMKRKDKEKRRGKMEKREKNRKFKSKEVKEDATQSIWKTGRYSRSS